jgi:protein-disulfide isomerase
MKVLRNSFAVGMWLVLLAPGILAGQAPSSSADQKLIAEVDGKPVYEKDIASQVQGRLIQLQHQEYEIRRQAVDSYIENEILANEARAEGLSTEALLKREVDAKVPQPADDAVHAYYIAQPNLRSRSFDEIKEQLRHALRQALIAQARKDYIDSLRAKATVRVFLEPPRLNVSYDSARLRGNPHAPVTIVEFSDFQCPFCRAAEATVRQILAKYPDRVSLAYRDFPLREIHPSAQKAAEAARCAQEQGKFWEYHDLLMSDPPRLDQNSLIADARSLRLDEKQFQSCLESGRTAPAVQRDVDAGMALGVTGTPGFFINGEFVSGAQPEAVFDKIIQADLAAFSQSAKLAQR